MYRNSWHRLCPLCGDILCGDVAVGGHDDWQDCDEINYVINHNQIDAWQQFLKFWGMYFLERIRYILMFEMYIL